MFLLLKILVVFAVVVRLAPFPFVSAQADAEFTAALQRAAKEGRRSRGDASDNDEDEDDIGAIPGLNTPPPPASCHIVAKRIHFWG